MTNDIREGGVERVPPWDSMGPEPTRFLAMVCGGRPGDEHFVGDAASPDDATRIVKAHAAALQALAASLRGTPR